MKVYVKNNIYVRIYESDWAKWNQSPVTVTIFCEQRLTEILWAKHIKSWKLIEGKGKPLFWGLLKYLDFISNV